MEYVTLNSGVKMPMAGIGTFLLTPDEAETSVLSALQNGYRLIDTANAYVNEKAVGRAMKKPSCGPRFMNNRTRWKRRWRVSIPTISTFCLFISPQAIIWRATA